MPRKKTKKKTAKKSTCFGINIFFPFYTFIGLFADCIDWIVIGLIPFLGDAFDVLMIAFWFWILRSPVALVGAVELIPLVDVLPVHTGIGLYADIKRGNNNE